jgi:hypothetical protein
MHRKARERLKKREIFFLNGSSTKKARKKEYFCPLKDKKNIPKW